ncbi:hypothetical protein C1645_765550 [Glomus cerebriforme]|uniref:Protein kinase domain-containing protein n=1 Tax=Glomus cerebriforme TaxID=658196 RepID=A0A397T261_9GLOM|nr:hypothetical protein C1645_765550 [Glomus cerebriforme]
MELTNTNENYFDPKPRLKSSPIPINFISFNNNARYCFYCKNRYTWTQSPNNQKYCEDCFSQYVNNVDGNNTYLDVLIETCLFSQFQGHAQSRREMFTTCNIKEWCKNCSSILCFKQIFAYTRFIYHYSLNEKPIPVLYLPWWDNSDYCLVCDLELKFQTNCQKLCTRCYIIHSGCRYCLTTNIIFGLSDQSQCRKCRRILVIDIKDITSGNSDIDALIRDTRFKIKNDHKIINDISSIDVTNPLDFYNFIRSNYRLADYHSTMEWISYSNIINLEKLAEGGFSIIYKAYWEGNYKTIAAKRLKSSEKISKEFLNEVLYLNHNITNIS